MPRSWLVYFVRWIKDTVGLYRPDVRKFKNLNVASFRRARSANPPMRTESVLETRLRIAPYSIVPDRGGESLEELRKVLKNTTFIPVSRINATINHYMSKYNLSEADAIRMILQEREQGR